MSDHGDPRERSLSENAERDRHLAAEARHDAELERPVAAGLRDHPHPDIAAADELRAKGDVRTYERQEALAAEQARAAEEMEDSQRRLYETARRLESIGDDVHARTGEVRALAGDARELREETRDIAEQVREIESPEV